MIAAEKRAKIQKELNQIDIEHNLVGSTSSKIHQNEVETNGSVEKTEEVFASDLNNNGKEEHHSEDVHEKEEEKKRSPSKVPHVSQSKVDSKSLSTRKHQEDKPKRVKNNEDTFESHS